ncbi:LysR family transcriptional regulator [Agrobacterium tumefaciens]|uniref:LysR family transcriptional regulator n=2 Tax=Rhizobium/Agrobacterium group TaxID=227290 RepID=A0A4D7Z0J0_AGRTU|nr:LysR family transcriptional regulator [Agrobacterium tumefaciens]
MSQGKNVADIGLLAGRPVAEIELHLSDACASLGAVSLTDAIEKAKLSHEVPKGKGRVEPKTPNPIDAEVGARIRSQRRAIGLSQGKLAFVAIVDTGGFGSAAKKVNRTPSAVSMQIKKLEGQLRTSLFVRSSQHVALTQSGEKLLFYARRLLAMSNEVVAQLLTPDLAGLVTLGAPNDIAERTLPRVLKEIDDAYPSITVNVVVGNSETLIDRAAMGQLDLTIVNFASDSAVEPGELLASEQIVWVGSKGGIAYRREPLPLALYGSGCIWREAAVKQLEESGRRYRIAYASNHSMMQRSVIGADLAVAPLPASYVTEDMVVLGKMEGFSGLPSFDIRMITVTEPTPPMQIIIERIKAVFGGDMRSSLPRKTKCIPK